MVKNVNTMEDYKALDKAAILNQGARTVRCTDGNMRKRQADSDAYIDMGCYE